MPRAYGIGRLAVSYNRLKAKMKMEIESEFIICQECSWRDGKHAITCQLNPANNNGEMLITSAVDRPKTISFIPATSGYTGHFQEDGAALAQFLFENLPAITFSVMIRKGLELSIF